MTRKLIDGYKAKALFEALSDIAFVVDRQLTEALNAHTLKQSEKFYQAIGAAKADHARIREAMRLLSLGRVQEVEKLLGLNEGDWHL